MKKAINYSSVLTIGIASALCFLGCKKAEQQTGAPAVGTQSRPTSIASAEKNSFQEVTSQLDPGGSVYVYLSTEQFLDGLSDKVSALRGALSSIPDLKANDRETLDKGFDLASHLVKDSGVQDVSAFGMSAIAREKDLYHTKMLLHHYPGKGAGFLWTLFGQKAHALEALDLLPPTTALASFSDLDLASVWSVLQKQVAQAGLPQAQEVLEKLPAAFEQATGLNWDKVLASLGGEYGLVITLDEAHKINLPLPSPEPIDIPEPGLLLVVRVKDDTIFNRIDDAVEQMVQHMGQQVVSVDKPDIKMRTLPLPLPLPIQLRPTVALSQGYLFIATTDGLVRDVLDIKAGKKPGLKSTPEFQRLAKDVPVTGNSFVFLSERLGKAFTKIQRQALQMAANRNGPGRADWLQNVFGSNQVSFSYSVSANTDQGWLMVANSSQNPAKLVLLPALVAPIGLVAAVAIPNFTKARETSQRSACINNLRQIAEAKQQWALENNKTEADTPMRSELSSYLKTTQFPKCPAGGDYTMNAVGTPPECSIPGHQLPAK